MDIINKVKNNLSKYPVFTMSSFHILFSLQRKDTHIRVSFPIVCLAEASSSNDD
ncbi:hypothetical protein bcgnr5398_47170 [Bacillus cereus]|nr:hypothetical protein BCM0075_0902 [Bacillus cereus]